MEQLLKIGLMIAGVSQLLLCIGSIAIPKCLHWSERTAALIPLMRQLFFTYACYILFGHLFFAVTSFVLAEELLQNTNIGNALLLFMALWWSGRLFCQFFYFDTTGIPNTGFNKVAEYILILMFLGLNTIYWGALLWNITH